jgi:hypothetical protein
MGQRKRSGGKLIFDLIPHPPCDEFHLFFSHPKLFENLRKIIHSRKNGKNFVFSLESRSEVGFNFSCTNI